MNDQFLLLTLCLEDDSILISNAVFEQLDHPRLIQMLINDERKSLMIRPCAYGERDALVIHDEPMYQFEARGKSLLRRIRRLTGWKDDTPRALYGAFLPEPGVIIFDLMSAQLAELQPIPEDETFLAEGTSMTTDTSDYDTFASNSLPTPMMGGVADDITPTTVNTDSSSNTDVASGADDHDYQASNATNTDNA